MSEIRRYLRQLDEASPRNFAKMLLEPTPEQEQALRIYLGQDHYRRMRGLALQLLSGSSANAKGRVVLIPDFMGTSLCRVDWDRREEPTPVWMNISRLMKGEFDQLRLEDDGVTGVDSRFDIVPSGIFKRDYGELILTLAKEWDVRILWYDWRKDLRIAASLLESKLREWFGIDQTAHLLGVGMGGLVAQWFIREYLDRWKRMRSDQNNGGRLLLLGVPNRGTYLAPQVLAGQSEIVNRLARIDHRQSYSQIVRTFRSFMSLYQLLPQPESPTDANSWPLFDVETYRTDLPAGQRDGDGSISDLEAWQASRVPERLLNCARKLVGRREIPSREDRADAFDRRTTLVSGYGFPTIVGLDWKQGSRLVDSFLVSSNGGDGIVPIEDDRPALKGDDEYFIEEYYIKAEHAALTSHPQILSSLSALLAGGKANDLEKSHPTVARGERLFLPRGGDSQAEVIDGEFTGILDHFASRRHAPEPAGPTVEERLLSEQLTRDLSPKRPNEESETRALQPPRELRIGLGLIHGRINEVDSLLSKSHHPEPHADAIAIGLYVGEKPSGPTLDLDIEISRAMLAQKGGEPADNADPAPRDLILTQFFGRGLIRADLGQPFFLTDPRVPEGADSRPDRLLALVGMGLPGRFGVPELTVLARELCWAVGRLGKQHLAVASIGTKDNNLSPAEAMSGWIRGIKAALEEADKNRERHLERLTLLIEDPGKIGPLQEAILNIMGDEDGDASQRTSDSVLKIDYARYDEKAIDAFQHQAIEEEKRRVEEQRVPTIERPAEPTLVTLGLSGSTYRYGAVRTGASVPDREITLRKELVEEVCAELSTERELRLQLERGRFLGKLILPSDLKEVLKGHAPVVMTLDSDTARIPWEMVALDEEQRKSIEPSREKLGPENYFLGTCRGLTRQLRTTFAPAPEPQPTLKRRLRVLVVADPARDHPLPGAELEGTEVADLFEKFNLVHSGTENSVEVVRMFGPSEAKLTNVLREIMTRPYDVLHFAGHCVYDKDNPAASGWLFSDGKLLTANELRRIDLIPKFIFSNACESGVTPDRSDKRSAALPPTFAESFFAQGVSNLVCTAWPVDDAAARKFAKALYAALLMMGDFADKPQESGRQGKLPRVDDKPANLMVMYEAMRYARLAIANVPGAARTWGAYQHYGDPFFRLLVPEALSREAARPSAGRASGSGRPDVQHRPGTSEPSGVGGGKPNTDQAENPASIGADEEEPIEKFVADQLGARSEQPEGLDRPEDDPEPVSVGSPPETADDELARSKRVAKPRPERSEKRKKV